MLSNEPDLLQQPKTTARTTLQVASVPPTPSSTHSCYSLQGRSIIPPTTFLKTKKITASLPKRSNDADLSTLQASDDATHLLILD